MGRGLSQEQQHILREGGKLGLFWAGAITVDPNRPREVNSASLSRSLRRLLLRGKLIRVKFDGYSLNWYVAVEGAEGRLQPKLVRRIRGIKFKEGEPKWICVDNIGTLHQNLPLRKNEVFAQRYWYGKEGWDEVGISKKGVGAGNTRSLMKKNAKGAR